jgi:hypothetical protein
MAVNISLTPGLPFFDLQMTLDDVAYTLQFRWNVRCERWFMDILDEQASTLLQAGICLVADFPLTAVRTGRTPPGIFVALDTSGAGLDPTIDDLGTRVQLIYFTEEEIAPIGQ